ncbi:exonuclease domain-containing protein [Acidovorax sp.]|uniref:3'-5' exonuclease n=1 Tax=Acidovorax sp. TaxID=1872122 RepID=UPI00391F4D6C
MGKKQEVFVSVDVESSGPIPGEFSMLTLGACLVDSPSTAFSMELKPLNGNFDAEALAVTGLSMEQLARTGLPPTQGMSQFASWISTHVASGAAPVFVGLNAAFDWSFVNYYFHRFIGTNPFGFAALDIKAFFMGATSCEWQETKSSSISKILRPSLKGNHDALDDARYQAELFRLTRELAASKSRAVR